MLIFYNQPVSPRPMTTKMNNMRLNFPQYTQDIMRSYCRAIMNLEAISEYRTFYRFAYLTRFCTQPQPRPSPRIG